MHLNHSSEAAVLFLLLLTSAYSQRYWAGISKSTWAASDPSKCSGWIAEYLPFLAQESNECKDGVCPCGQVGRFHISNATGTSIEPGDSNDVFGIHTVACTYHASGTLSVAELERGLQVQFGNFTKYDPLMDNNMGFWVNSLGALLSRFEDDGVKHYKSTWKYDGKRYFSTLVNPCGYQLIELMSTEVGDRIVSSFNAMPSRMDFIAGKYNTASPPNPLGMAPLRLSRATTDLDRLVEFYEDVMNATLLRRSSFDGGVRSATMKLRDTQAGPTTVQIQLWERPPSAAANTWTVARWSKYLLSTHQAVMKTPTCGFDRMLDYHFAYDCIDEWCNEDSFISRLQKYGIKHRWQPCPHNSCPVPNLPGIQKTKSGDMYFVYTYDTTGMGIQLHFGHWTAPPPTSSIPPSCIRPPSYYNGSCPGQLNVSHPWQCS